MNHRGLSLLCFLHSVHAFSPSGLLLSPSNEVGFFHWVAGVGGWGGGANPFIWLLKTLRRAGKRKSHLKDSDNRSFSFHKRMPCALYLSLPDVSHYAPTNSPVSHGSTHVVDAFRLFSNGPNRPGTSAVIGLLISVQMFQAVFPELQVYSVKLQLLAI